jgi:hypothetical protein
MNKISNNIEEVIGIHAFKKYISVLLQTNSKIQSLRNAKGHILGFFFEKLDVKIILFPYR